MRWFWLLSFALAWAITVPPAIAKLGLIEASPVPPGIGILIGVAPIMAAALVAAGEGWGRAYWRSLLRVPRPSWTALLALFLPPALLVVTYFIRSAVGEPIRVALDMQVVMFSLLWLALAFGEEAGWRGFALPRLTERHGFWLGSLILGVVWCVWHYPKLLGSPYLGPVSDALPLIGLFSIQIVISNFIISWIYFRSGRSVAAVTLYHASFNTVATTYFLAATDLVMTGLMAFTVVIIALVDPKPHKG